LRSLGTFETFVTIRPLLGNNLRRSFKLNLVEAERIALFAALSLRAGQSPQTAD